MKNRLALIIVAAVILLVVTLAGCQPAGIPQAQYDQARAQLQDAQAKLAEAQNKASDLQAKQDAAAAQLKAAQAKINELQGEVGGLQGQVGELTLTGATTAETVEKIVRNYHETHNYSKIDLFICSDMSAEVWNILKTQGIGAIVGVGSVEAAITDIIQSDHAWLLADVGGGERLALETTGGFVAPKSQYPLYYRGWYFESPADLKEYNNLVREYNVRVTIHNQIVDRDRAVIADYNAATSQSQADKLEAVHKQLTDILGAQEAEMQKIINKISGMAKVLS